MKIDIRNVTHNYDVEVLHDLTFKLDGYKSVAIIGISVLGNQHY
jgi:ABC-type phosphate/phosphonate transport system ATPase subunit